MDDLDRLEQVRQLMKEALVKLEIGDQEGAAHRLAEAGGWLRSWLESAGSHDVPGYRLHLTVSLLPFRPARVHGVRPEAP